jgi:hypothetical protein
MYGNTSYFFPAIENGQMKHISDQTLRLKFKEFMQMCEFYLKKLKHSRLIIGSIVAMHAYACMIYEIALKRNIYYS